MGTLHDIESKKACDAIIKKWKSLETGWVNKTIAKDIAYSVTSKNFPSPDRNFYSPDTKIRIAIEFKPYKRETRRGLLTGVGQAMAYLHNDMHSAAYLLIPDTIRTSKKDTKDFPIGDFLENVFKKKIKGKIPLGLITFKPNDLTNVKMRCIVDENIELKKIVKEGAEGVGKNYWMFWRDEYPHQLFTLLNIASKEKSKKGRSKKIWDKYFFQYYCPKKVSNTLNLVETTKLKKWDGKYIIPFEKIKKYYQEYIDGKIRIKNKTQIKFKKYLIANSIIKPNIKDALRCFKKMDISTNVKENTYQNYKKNHKLSIGHLGLWDNDTWTVNERGKLFLRNIKLGGDLMYELSKLILVAGRYGELIRDIKKVESELASVPTKKSELIKEIVKRLEERGFIQRNTNRKTSGIRKDLQSELQIMKHIGVLDKNYVFDMKKIKKIEKEYLKTYGKLDEGLI